MVTTTAGETRRKARNAIIRTLRNHPGITRSMLSTATRPYLPTSTEWSQLLDDMITAGEVVRDTRTLSQGRAQVIFTLGTVSEALED